MDSNAINAARQRFIEAEREIEERRVERYEEARTLFGIFKDAGRFQTDLAEIECEYEQAIDDAIDAYHQVTIDSFDVYYEW